MAEQELRLSYPTCTLPLVGERFTVDVTVRRRWWQMWKPRQRSERCMYRVIDVIRSD